MHDSLPEDADADADALRRLAADGSDLSRPMQIDFFVAVPNEAAGQALGAAIEPLGFTPSLSFDDESGAWTCCCMRTMVPDHDAIVAAQVLLGEVGSQFDARADGWGTFGNAPETE